MNHETNSARALFSNDARQWGPGHDPEDGTGIVTKIVIGNLEKDEDKPKTQSTSDELLAEIEKHAETLTHLHLWHLENLKELPILPAGLKCLDVRGCVGLASLPVLPVQLETLDVGDCQTLATLPREAPKSLIQFYFNGCTSLRQRALENFLDSASSTSLKTLDGSGCQALVSLEDLPASLQKLVLKQCRSLKDANRIAQLPALNHLDLSDCTALTELSNLPDSVRYLILHGSEDLKRFHGQDIGPYDRGTRPAQNVVKTFHSRRKFGKELAASAHAKLLLMGDGRVGKSTLAKRLLWESLTPEQQEDPDFSDLKPRDKEDPTHKMHFWRWEAPLRLPGETFAELRERAEAARLALPPSDDGDLKGAVRIWDFGGQEIYHNTHRIFAAEGSVFLLVWREDPPDLDQTEEERPTGCDPQEWLEWNRQRPLDYWLDYIFSMRPDAKVALVCTCCGKGKPRPDWTVRAPRHAATERGRQLRCFYIDSLEDGCAKSPEYLRLSDWLKIECGREAERIGIIQPAFFSQVADQVDAMLKENAEARDNEKRAPHLLLTWSEWHRRVIERHQKVQIGEALNADDVDAITGYLHDAGQLFVIRDHEESAVLIDQAWATTLIYEMLRPGGRLHKKIVYNRGWFPLEELDEEAEWERLSSDLERTQLIHYMETSHVLVKVIDKEQHGDRKTIFVANEKWLLPEEKVIRDTLELQMKVVRELPFMDTWEAFSFEDHEMSEFDFRDLMAYLGKRFGRYATWFRRGLQAMPDEQAPEWCFRLRWVENEKDAFYGKVDAVLVTRKARIESLAEQVEELFADEGCPLAQFGKPKRSEASVADLTHEYISPLTPGQEEVGVSSSGADKQEVEDLVVALKWAGLKVVWYQLQECRSDEYAKVKVFIEKGLRNAPCLILILSDAYVRLDPVNNWYCPWELADAINRWIDGKRSIARTFVIYKEGDQVTWMNLDTLIAQLFEDLADHFGKAYTEIAPRQRPNFKYYDEISHHFTKAWQDGRVGKFFEERGTPGSFSVVPTKEDGTKDYDSLIEQVRQALKKP